MTRGDVDKFLPEKGRAAGSLRPPGPAARDAEEHRLAAGNVIPIT